MEGSECDGQSVIEAQWQRGKRRLELGERIGTSKWFLLV
jgi:hypothetical protein